LCGEVGEREAGLDDGGGTWDILTLFEDGVEFLKACFFLIICGYFGSFKEEF